MRSAVLRAGRALARFRRDRRGTTAVEFALIGLPLVILLLGLIEFGRGLHIRSALANAADHTQRMVLIDPDIDATALRTRARQVFAAGDSAALDIQIGAATQNGHAYRTIGLSYDMQLLLPAPLGRTVTLAMERQVLVP